MAEYGLSEVAKGKNLLRATRDRVKWTAMIAYVLTGHGTSKGETAKTKQNKKWRVKERLYLKTAINIYYVSIFYLKKIYFNNFCM